MMNIAENVERVRATITEACERVGRDPAGVTLLAVSKRQTEKAILAAHAAGVQHFGENRVEEATTKIPAVNAQLNKPIVWHMVGHIQSRKARDVPALFQVIHSVDRLKLATKLSQLAVEQGMILDVLLEMNVSGEASKGGFMASGWAESEDVRKSIWSDVEQIATLPGLTVRGLMTMAPIVSDMELARPVFAELATLRGALTQSLDVKLPDLSMGMTDDYPIAVEEGATIVRVGRAIFGPRDE